MSRRMYWTAWRLTESKQEAEDLVQDVFLRLWTQREALPEILNTEAYCIRLVQRRFLDLRRTRRPEVSLPDAADLLPSGDDLYRETELQNQKEYVESLISQLPDRQREVITLRDLEDRPYEEIASRTGLTQVNVRALLSRARKAIREKLGSMEI